MPEGFADNVCIDLVLKTAGIKNFPAREICPVGKATRHHKTGKIVLLREPPVDLVKNILPTLELAEWLRAKAGNVPLRVLSGYRDPAYNAAVGGEEDSLHMKFNALDIHSYTKTPAELAALVETHPQARTFGLGIYKSFIHIDTRSILGYATPARWRG